MAGVQVKLNPAGVRALLHDPGVVADLVSRGEAVADAHGGDCSVDVEIYPSGRAIVHVTDNDPKSLFREAHNQRLANALAAARAKRERPGSKWGPRKPGTG